MNKAPDPVLPVGRPNIPVAVRKLIEQYRRFLRTSYRFLDPKLRSQFEAHLAQAEVVVRGPFVTLARDFVRGSTLRDLASQGKLQPELIQAEWPFGANRLFRHQEVALEKGRKGKCLLLTTGTGSGKTEAFLLPVLDGIVRRKREGVRGVQAVLMYPMNALANDQLERLRRLLRGTGLPISFALYTGDSEAASKSLREEPAETELITRAAIRRSPPDILLTNYKQLEFLVVRPDDRPLFTEALKFLVLDEIHSYRGALATEIACLIRRLKDRAGIGPGHLQGIGTSATVASGEEGPSGLARFASVLFGEEFQAQDVVGESLVPFPKLDRAWLPPLPNLSEEELSSLDPKDDGRVIALAERLSGRRCELTGTLADRIGGVLEGNALVGALEETFSEPKSISDAITLLRQRFPERREVDAESIRREVEAYLLVGSVGDEDSPPRLRPKLHTFFHGVYNVSLCLNPECRSLVPQGGEECLKCGSVARPAALCRTCGQDFVKVRFEAEDDDRPVGSGDFYSGDLTGFLTHEIHKPPEDEPGGDEDDGDGDAQVPAKKKRKSKPKNQPEPVGVCLDCGRIVDEGAFCLLHSRPSARMLLHRGKLNTCPACGDVYTRGDIVTPLRTGTASTVSVLATHHLDSLEGGDRRLLVFADNRQDVAHQAGYTADKHRSFALRHAVAKEVREAGASGIHLQELPERLFDHYRNLGIVPRRWTRPERDRWLFALTYEAANEFTRFSRQRASLENLGLVAVEYEFLDLLGEDPGLLSAAAAAGLERDVALGLVRALLDVVRRKRAVAYDFFQEYLDPSSKRRYRELEEAPYNVRFPDKDRRPVAFALDRPDHIRKGGRLTGFYQENPKAGQLTAVQKVVARLAGDRHKAEAFLRSIVPLLEHEDGGILKHVPRFPIPAKERDPRIRPLQIDPRVIRLVPVQKGFKCNSCQVWRPYRLPTCPSPRCSQGVLHPSLPDVDNYYYRLYLDRPPQRLSVAEHSAQIGGEERAKRETSFKEGRLDVLVCTPTLELGVDIGPLLTVVLRNAPPSPANYAQRVGRAGRRLRIGFASTFCGGGPHDRQAFEEPGWMVAGRFEPPRLRMDNVRILQRHLHSHLLGSLSHQLPSLMGELLDDLRHPTRWKREAVEPLLNEVRDSRPQIVERLTAILVRDREAGRLARFDQTEIGDLVERFEGELTRILEGWWERVRQLDREFREYSTVGSPRQDERKASARKRAYFEITQDPDKAYALSFLSTEGLLPAYQFPVDTFRLDPGVQDTPTLYRPAAIAIEEFAPGNFVYANGHKLRSIRVLYPGGPGTPKGRIGKTDAETSGRLLSFHFCDVCDEVVEATRNNCNRCGSPLPKAEDAVFVEAFEAEESLRIGSEEESRQRQFHDRRESLLLSDAVDCRLHPYPLAPAEHLRLAHVLVTNWGRLDTRAGSGRRFFLCPDCGRHLPYDPNDQAKHALVQEWSDNHARICPGRPVPLILAYKFSTDCLVLGIPGREDAYSIGKLSFSPTTVTLAEALLAGAGQLLELEQNEIRSFVRKGIPGASEQEIVFYETVPGGAGYLEEMARRLPEVAKAAEKRLYGHACAKGCYLCLKHYGNQRWHPFFDKNTVRDLLFILAQQDPVEALASTPGSGLSRLKEMIAQRQTEALEGSVRDPATGRYRKGFIEEPLMQALSQVQGLPSPNRELEFKEGERVLTVPDFAWEDAKLAVYCDGFAVHGNPETLMLDAKKRNRLQQDGWVVLTYWGRTILKNPETCAMEIADVYRQRKAAP